MLSVSRTRDLRSSSLKRVLLPRPLSSLHGNRGSNCCNWEGVTCDAESGLVTELDLSLFNIYGKIGSSLFNVISLQKLNLAYNDFSPSSIPAGFELLANLTSLNLSNAGFFGQIPIGIAKLTNLVTLDLSTFWLRSSLKLENPNFKTLIQNMSNLRELYLDSVNISDNGYQWSATVAKSTPKLRVLSLSSCSITGPIDSSLLELRDLSVIQLDENELNSDVPEFVGNFSSLSVLRLGFCGLNGIFPKNAFLLKNLTVIDLSGNPMLSGSLPDFADDSKLESLQLSETNFSGYLPNSTGKLKSMRTMDLSSCQFSGFIPPSIGNLSQLIYLYLWQNKFTGAVPSVLPPRISELILPDNMLTGLIPSSISKLQHLRKLDLSNNLLSGQIPAPLFSLPALQELRLNLNQLSGQLQEFSNGSPPLEVVDMSNNRLQGEIPRSVFQLSGLKILSLASNNFSGTVELEPFSSLRNLADLDLSYSGISVQDNGGNDSVSFPKFGTLMLASCNLTRVPDFLRYQKDMGSLDLSNNKIHGAIPSWIWSIGNNSLNYLNLSCNLFTSVEGPLPNFNFRPDIILDLHSNLLRGPIPLPPVNTIILDYSNNYFSSSIPSNISLYLSSTLYFSLAKNNLTGEIPTSICKASYLEILDFSDNNFTGLIPLCILEGSSSLVVLNLQRNRLHGTMPKNISQGCPLRTLNLNGNHLEGLLPDSLVNCNELEVLNIGNNHMVDSFPFWLGRIPLLRVLDLRSNEFYGLIEPHPSTHETNFTFPRLQILDISSNHFNGTLSLRFFKNLRAMMDNSRRNSSIVQYAYLELDPLYYQDSITITSKGLDWTLPKILTIFTSMDLSNNDFVGDIPEVFGKFQSLNVLNLSHNALTGQIPSVFGNMKQLESLDLSANQLTGQIPQDLASLTFVSFLNLSDNNLVGRIPQGNQLSTFSNSSFEGNEGLCGIPLTKQCSNVTEFAEPPPSKSSHSPSTYVIALALFVGLGFGVGIAVVIVLQNVSWKCINAPLISQIWAKINVWTCSAAMNVKKKLKKTSPSVGEERRTGLRG